MGKSCSLSAGGRPRRDSAVDRGARALHNKWLCAAVSFWLPATGESNVAIAERLSVEPHTVMILWAQAFC